MLSEIRHEILVITRNFMPGDEFANQKKVLQVIVKECSFVFIRRLSLGGCSLLDTFRKISNLNASTEWKLLDFRGNELKV